MKRKIFKVLARLPHFRKVSVNAAEKFELSTYLMKQIIYSVFCNYLSEFEVFCL